MIKVHRVLPKFKEVEVERVANAVYLELLDKQETLELLGNQDDQGLLDVLEIREDRLVSLVNRLPLHPAILVRLDHPVHLVLQDSQEMLDPMDLLDFLEGLDPLDVPDPKDLPDILANLEPLDALDSPDRMLLLHK